MTEKGFPMGRWIAALLVLAGLLMVFYQVVADNMPKGEVREVEGYRPWQAETLAVAETIPVQDGGRVKPLSSQAGFTMLRLHGARSMKISGEFGKVYKIKPTEWMMDALFRPHLAIHQPTFRVDNSAVLEAIGLEARGKRDRYSYADLEKGRDRLGELAQTYGMLAADERDPVQNQIMTLASNLQVYESLLGYLGFARSGAILPGSGGEGEADKRADFSALMATAPQIREQMRRAQAHGDGGRMSRLLQQILDGAGYARSGLFILPPAVGDEPGWKSAGMEIMAAMGGSAENPEMAFEDIRALEKTARSLDGGEKEFRRHLEEFRDRTKARAEARGEYDPVKLEASYYRMNLFVYALVFFLTGTLAALTMWTFGKGVAGTTAAWVVLATTLMGAACCVAAITMRCLIMERPPVGNLYDTIVFIATSVTLISLVVEWMTKRRFALGIAPILGTALILLARRFELGDAKDHMDPLVAVLDSNFWLTTHVITITLGYSAGLLAAFLSAGYVLWRGLGLDEGNLDLRRSLTRAVYGMLCFTLFLSLVGTVLGGIWANYSWGRFWGWDPKENGALLIVLWTLAVLHARLGGYLREWGIHLASVFTAIVVTFSWWHVNFLGVGLHNYGFTAGKSTIWAFYATMGGVLLFGSVMMVLQTAGKKRTN